MLARELARGPRGCGAIPYPQRAGGSCFRAQRWKFDQSTMLIKCRIAGSSGFLSSVARRLSRFGKSGSLAEIEKIDNRTAE